MNWKSTAIRLALAVCSVLIFSATRASASPTVAPCPQVGFSNGCDEVITITGTAGHLMASVTVTGQPAYDGCDDQIVGVINNSSVVITGLVVNGSGIGGFDGDGPWAPGTSCTVVGGQPYPCLTPSIATNPGDYSGSLTTFPTYSANSVTVSFDTPLATGGGSAYFGLEEPPSTGVTIGSINPTPEPGTLVLFGSGLIGLAGVLRRRLAK
jgi:hypothetical protein